jgi:hypothetical protein
VAQNRTTQKGPQLLEGPVGGVNTRAASTKLPPGNFLVLRNCELVEDVGIVSVRRGTKQLTTSSLGTGAIFGGIRWYYGATPTAETLFVWLTTLYRLVGAATSPTSIGSVGGSAGERIFIPFVGPGGNEYVMIGTDVSAARRYEPLAPAVRTAGFPAPSAAPTAATGAAGVLTGAYLYKYSNVFDSVTEHESSVYSIPSNQVNPVAQQVGLTGVTVGPTGTTSRRIYRTKAIVTANPLYYFVGTIGDNVTTTFTDNVADASLSAVQAPTDNGIPPLAKHWAMMKGRMYALSIVGGVTRRGRLMFSAVASTERNPDGTVSVHGKGPEIFPSTYFIDIGDVNGVGTGLMVMGDTLVIFLGNEIHLLRDNGASDMNVWKAEGNVGCIAAGSIVDMGKLGIFFLGRDNTSPCLYRFLGQKAYPISESIEPTLRANLVGLTSAYTVKPHATKYRGQYMLSYARDATPNYEIAKYDVGLGRWSFDRGPKAASWIPFQGSEDGGQLLFGHAVDGWLVTWDVDGGDFDATAPTNPLDMLLEVEFGWDSMGRPNQRKQLKWVYVMAEVQAGATLTLERLRDFNTSGSTVGSNAQAMTATISGTQVFGFRIAAEKEGGSVAEGAFYHKFKLSVAIPYTASSDPFKPVKIHDISVYEEERTPGQHVP